MSRTPSKSAASGPDPEPEPGGADEPTPASGPADPVDPAGETPADPAGPIPADSADPAGARVGGRRVRPGLVLATCCTALFVSSMNAVLINVALPMIRVGLGASTTQLQWVVDAYTLMIASLLLATGSMADRFGRKRVFMTGLVLFAAASALCALAPTTAWLIAGRGLQAVGGAMLTPVALSIISATYTDATARARAIGVWGAVSGVSLGLGPIAGGLLTDAFGWEASFWLNVPVCAAAIVATALFVPESRAPRPRRLDPAGQLLMMVFLAGVVGTLIEGPEIGWSSPPVLVLAGTAAAGLAVFVVVELRAAEPMVDIRFFGSAPFSASMLIAVAVFTVQGAFLFLMSLLLQGPLGYSASATGALLVPMAVVLALSSPFSGRMVGRRGTRPSLVIGGAGVSLAGLMLALLPADARMWYLLAAFMVLGVGLGFVNPPITTTAVAGLPLSQAGAASGMASASRQVGVALGVAVAGSVAGADDARLVVASRPVFWLAVALGLVVVVLGVVSTTEWARGTRRRLDALFSA